MGNFVRLQDALCSQDGQLLLRAWAVTRLIPFFSPLRQAQWHARPPFTFSFLWLARILAPLLLALLPPACLLTTFQHTFSLTHPQNASQAATLNLGAGRHLGSFSPFFPGQHPVTGCSLPPIGAGSSCSHPCLETTAFLPAPPQFLPLNSPAIWISHQLLFGLIGYQLELV